MVGEDMGTSKINIDGVNVEVSLGIDEDEIERNEYDLEDTIELEEVISKINEGKEN